MGCGASAPKPIQIQQMEEMCKDNCKDMEVLCVTTALAAPDKIKIAAPGKVAEIRKSIEGMRAQAKELEAGSAAPAEAAPAAGGMMGSLMGAAAAVADKAGDLAGAGAAKALSTLADALDESLKKVEEPFQRIGKDICTSNKDAIMKVFVDYINKFEFTDAIKIVRGEAPWNSEQYGKVPSDSISKTLLALAQKDIVAQLLPATKDAIMKHDVTSTWKTMNDAYNMFFDALAALVDVKKLEEAGIKRMDPFDLENEVIGNIYTKIGEIMSAEETATRTNSANKAVPQPKVFMKVFSPIQLSIADYDMWKNKQGV